MSTEKTLKAGAYAEGKAKIAINMPKANKPLVEITLFTGLSQDEIIQLKNEL